MCINRTFLDFFPCYLVNVVLDPDTAHPNIVLSADGKQAGRGELLHIVPDLPMRFDPVICVVAKKGFLSGRFYFQVLFYWRSKCYLLQENFIHFESLAFLIYWIFFHYSAGCSGDKDLLGLGGGQGIYQQEGNDHVQARERLLDGPTAERERVSCLGFSLCPPPPEGEATDCGSVYRL